MSHFRTFSCCGKYFAALVFAVCSTCARPSAAELFAYVTGSSPGGEAIFRVSLDPATPASAMIAPVVTDSLRLDGIDFVAGDLNRVVVGAQGAGDGAIAHFNVALGAKLPDFVPSANAVFPSPPASGVSRPSTVHSTGAHVYYTENQFGFAGATHRIMRTPIAGPAGSAAVVFDGAAAGALGLRNFEGLETAGGRLYFFAEDHLIPTSRALYGVTLDGSGIWDGTSPSRLLGALTKAAASSDGSDELDFDPATGLLYGTNIISGEVIEWDPVAGTGGFLIGPAAIAAAAPGSNLERLGSSVPDGVRATGSGYLVITGLDGVILSINIAGIHGNGLDDGDILILYDDRLARRGLHFDDLSPLAVPEPSLTAAAAGGGALLVVAHIRAARRRHRLGQA